MLTGRPLFEMEGHMEVLSAKLSKPAPLLDNVVPGIFSLSLQKLLCRALERNPSDRIVSAQAFLDAIHRIENEPGHGLAIAPATKQLLKVAVRRVTVLPQLFKQYLSDWFRCEEQKPSEPTWRLRLEGLWTTTAGRKTIAFSSIPLVVLCLIGFLILSAVGENEPTLKTHKDTHPKLSSNVSLNSRPRVSSGISNLPPNSNQQRPTNARSPLDSRLARARKLLASNACREATSELSQVLRRNPKLAGGYYLLGNALICRKMYREGLNAYAEAIRLDPNYRQDDKILKDAERLLKVTKLKTTVVDFLDSKMGPSALPLLVKVGSYYSKETLRHRARDLVVKQGASNQIDWFASLVLDFKQEKSCKKRGVIVNRLKKLKDPRAIPFLRQARDERTGFWGNKYKNWCIRSQLVEALKELQSQ
jgi:tetratricopeptide (TPR) repeat protein